MASSTLSSDTNQTGICVYSDTDQNFLQKHAGFFDRNKDGLIYPWETFEASLFINVVLGYITRSGKWPSLLFPIEIKNIAKAKHTSDSGIYDSEGGFVPSKFEEIFKNYAHTNPDALTTDELSEMLTAKRKPMDYIGWTAAFLEWKLLFYMCKDVNGLLSKETIRGVFDGSLFEQMEKGRRSSKKKT
ncbi:hypothetical protein Q3G72_026383 [Acer saccharum]|nr:hypothetical protein Q3G72_026383 [Acer saccharum]